MKVAVGFPGDPVFKTPCSIAVDLDCPWLGSKIWHAMQGSQSEIYNENKSNPILINPSCDCHTEIGKAQPLGRKIPKPLKEVPWALNGYRPR